MKKEYLYPDNNNEITIALISKKEPYQGYWERSERYILDTMKRHIENCYENKTNGWFLDAGCGTGRLLPEFDKYFNRILAIDPDPYSLGIARSTVRERGFAEKVVFQNVSIEKLDWKEGSIDVILCSHVLQHVHTNSITLILNRFEQLLKNNGMLFVTTCHSRKKHDFYAKSYLKNHDLIEEIIDQNEFNSLICNEMNILPLHFFSKRNIINLLTSFHFKILDLKFFHILNKVPLIDQIIFRDKLFNFFLRSRIGRDMFIAARKQIHEEIS